VSGNVEGDEDLVVEGRVEGSISISRLLIVESTGFVQAEVNVHSVAISGVVVGNITAEASVQINEEGRVMGDIRAPRVALADGASFSGNIDMGEFDVEQALEPAEAPEPPARIEVTPNRGRRIQEVDEEEARASEPAAEGHARAKKPAAKAVAAGRKTPAKTPAYATSAEVKKKSAPVPRVRAIGRTKAKKKNV
jgi:cytoskeletal protein CcmA (bactofilin family)